MNELQTVTVQLGEVKEGLVDGTITLPDNVHSGFALLMPKVKNVPYIKGASECTVNSMHRCITALKPNKSRIAYEDINSGKTDDGVHEELMVLMKGMANLMQRIVHSSSWRDEVLHEHDIHEFKREIRNLGVRL
jgi:hypothetical protein